MAAPTDALVIWATDDVVLPVAGQQNKIRPQDSLILTGWDKTQKPSAEEFNYVLNNLAQWIDYYGVENINNLLLQYLRKDQNLDDLADKAVSRTNLDVYSKSQVDGKTITAGTGLMDGGTIGSNPTINMGTPSTVGSGSSNSATADSHSHALSLNTSNISILTGTIASGGTIPLPAGYTEGQCSWIASPYNMYDLGNSDMSNFKTTLSGRVVTVHVDDTVYAGNLAYYMIIGVK